MNKSKYFDFFIVFNCLLAEGICPEGWHIPSVEEFFDALAPLSVKKKVHFFDEGKEWDEEIFVFNSKYSSLMGFKSGEEYWTKDQIHCCDDPDEFAHTFVVEGKEITNRSNLYGKLKTAKLQIRCMKDR